jgi:NTP pyrophosphatase (non-canonical NTP hydrolase)
MNNQRNINNLINAGNKAQVEKLIENNHKHGFDHLSIDECIAGLLEEKDEACEEYNKKVIDFKALRRELADVANYAHMGIMACDREILKIKEEEPK